MLIKCAELYSKSANIYWGKKASGLLIFCRDDGTLLLLHRSPHVENPGTWGIPGGAIGEGFSKSTHGEKDPQDIVFIESAFKEAQEELGAVPMQGKYLGETAFRDGNFTYKTFVYNVPLQEKNRLNKLIKLNWENDGWEWFRLEDLPGNMHKGVLFSLRNLVEQSSKGEEN